MLNRFQYQRFRNRTTKKLSRLKLTSMIVFGAFCALLVGILSLVILLAWYAKDLPRPDKISRSEGLSTVILDRSGETIYDIFQNENRIPVAFSDIPQALKNATVSVEDKEFYKHKGISTSGIIRAFTVILFRGSIQGGSTLTQQLVKNVLLTQEQTIPRKLKEAMLAIQIEQKYSKDEILQMYLNETPYGGTAVGVEAASKYYFNKHTKELTVAECVILAGLPQAPSFYSPFGNDPKAYIPRAKHVLARMKDDGYIDETQRKKLETQITNYTFEGSGEESLKAPHFVAYVKDQLVEKFGQKTVDAGGLRVTTTLDLPLQEKVQTIVKEEVDAVAKLKVSNGAAVVINPKTGEILAMVGSKDYMASESGGYKFNVAVQALRQPGSAIKPISYAAALLKGYTGSTMLMDVETKYPSGEAGKPEYNPKNYDLKYRGPMEMRYALGNSINTIAVKLTALTGIREVLQTAYDMGLTTLEPTNENLKKFGLSITLGGGEVHLLDLTSAFGVFAAGGERSEPYSIAKVTDSKGKILYDHKQVSPRRVIPDGVAFIISSILSDNDARKDVFGVSSKLVIPGHTVAVKTGTTDDKRDNWTVGFTPSAVVGVWVGNNDNSPMDPRLASGVTGAAPIWNRIMREIVSKTKTDEPFTKPDSVIQMEIDGYGGGTAKDGYAKRNEYFIKGTEPTVQSPIYQMIKISKNDKNKLANPVEIAKEDYENEEFIIIREADPISTDGKNRWQEGIDTWVASQPDRKFHPPVDTYEGSDKITLSITDPHDHDRINDNNVRISAKAASFTDIRQIQIFVDGDKKKENSGSEISEVVQIPNGIHTIRVEAKDSRDNSTSREITVAINQDFVTPTPIPSPTTPVTPTPTKHAPSPTP